MKLSTLDEWTGCAGGRNYLMTAKAGPRGSP